MALKTRQKSASRETRRRRSADDAPWPAKDMCCCPPRIALSGGTWAKCCVIGNSLLEDDLLQVRADANASVNPPGGPQVNADGSGGSEMRTMLRKDIDLVEAVICYRFDWQAEGHCQPLAVRVQVDGDVRANMRCAPDHGHTELTMRKVQKAQDINTAPRGTATATVTVQDCSGQRAQCSLTLYEP